MYEEKNDDHQNSKLQQNDSMFYLDQNESLTGSLNPGGPSAVQTGSTNDDFQKLMKDEMDLAYEKMMESRRFKLFKICIYLFLKGTLIIYIIWTM